MLRWEINSHHKGQNDIAYLEQTYLMNYSMAETVKCHDHTTNMTGKMYATFVIQYDRQSITLQINQPIRAGETRSRYDTVKECLTYAPTSKVKYNSAGTICLYFSTVHRLFIIHNRP